MKRILVLLLTAGLVLSGCGKSDTGSSADSSSAAPAASGAKKLTIGLLPKAKGNPYFVSVAKGAQKAADELGDTLIFDGPTNDDASKQNETVENWINSGVDVIAVAAEDKDSLSTPLRKAEAKGIKVVSFDADVLPDARSFFVNQATPQGIGYALMDKAAQLSGNTGEFAIITASLTAANQNEWRKYIEEDLAKNYPNMKEVDFRPGNDDKTTSQTVATELMSAHPNLKLIMAISSIAVPAAAEAVKQAGKIGTVNVIGLGLPNENKQYVHDGVTNCVILWNTGDLGYLTVQAADALVKGTLKPGDKTFKVGDKSYDIAGDKNDNILLGAPTVFDKSNIDQFDF
jgi:ABC-type sugar transport system substrate-binding protein